MHKDDLQVFEGSYPEHVCVVLELLLLAATNMHVRDVHVCE